MCAENIGVFEEMSSDCSEICKLYDILLSVLLSGVQSYSFIFLFHTVFNHTVIPKL